MQSETCIDFVDLCIGVQHLNCAMCQTMRSSKFIEIGSCVGDIDFIVAYIVDLRHDNKSCYYIVNLKFCKF
jgi:hypothetical protein